MIRPSTSCCTVIVLSIAVVLNVTSYARAVIDIDFDAAYTVANSGSTDPVNEFDINGPAPWLYLNLPDAALTSFLFGVSTDWYDSTETAKQFSVNESWLSSEDEFWFTPLEQTWNATKSLGDWHIDARHQLVELIIIYGGGVGRVWASGSANIEFTVVDEMYGDFDDDLDVDNYDLGYWQDNYGTNSLADADDDGDSDGRDFLIWQRSYSRGMNGLAALRAVPEPSPLLLLILATVGGYLTRRTV